MSFGGRVRDRLYKAYQKHVDGVQLSSIHLRTGSSGAHRELFSEQEPAFFDARASEAMHRLGYNGNDG